MRLDGCSALFRALYKAEHLVLLRKFPALLSLPDRLFDGHNQLPIATAMLVA